MNKNRIVRCILGLCVIGVMSAGAVPIFKYSFPASHDGSGAVLTDLSTAGNNATLHAAAALIDDRPAGFDASLMSLSGANGGHGATTATNLLNTLDVVANGGFIMDVWFKWPGKHTDVRKLIDYAGTEYLRTRDSKIQFRVSSDATLLSHDITSNQWYHAVGIFDTCGNSAVADPNYPGEYKVDGFAWLYIDGVLVDSSVVTKTGYGDSFGRSIGINRWPDSADWNQGMIFNPEVSLNPKPSTLPSMVPVLEYSFPASHSNGTGKVLTDLSSSSNNAMLHADADLIDDRPAGFTNTLMSLSGSGGGHGVTDANDLLHTLAVVANGGFTMDVWFKWKGNYTNIRKLIDYAGTEFLRTYDSKIQFRVSSNATLSHDITSNQWYHAVAIFDTLGNSAVVDTNYPGNYKVDGFARLYIDGVLVDSSAVTKTGYGDNLNRSIGINRWPGAGSSGTGAEWNQGYIFNPRVYFDVYEGVPVAVEDLAISGPVAGGMVLSWTGELGMSYGMETNLNLLVASGWQPFTNGILGDGGTLAVTNTIGSDKTFYRVISE